MASRPDRVTELVGLPGPVHAHCASGCQAGIAASLLERLGIAAAAVGAELGGWGGHLLLEERGQPRRIAADAGSAGRVSK